MITRFHSKTLDLPCKYDTETGIVTVKELQNLNDSKYIEYGPEELAIINKDGGEITQNVHNVRNYFDGTIINKVKLADLKMKGIM
jgi:hypothetical protein